MTVNEEYTKEEMTLITSTVDNLESQFGGDVGMLLSIAFSVISRASFADGDVAAGVCSVMVQVTHELAAHYSQQAPDGCLLN